MTLKHRILAVLLALCIVFTLIPAGVIAAEGTTIAGTPVTVDLAEGQLARENDFNKGWKFNLGDNSSAQEQNFNDSSWENVNLPHDFSINQHFTASGEAESGFLPGGTGWYRKTFVMPEDAAGKTILLNFDGVYMHSYVYVNDTFVGEHHYGYSNFAMDITKYLVCDGASENVIAVKVVNQLPSSRWYSGSGIYRDVTMIVTDPVHVDLNGTKVTTPNIASGKGNVNVEVDVVNDSESKVTATVKNTVYAKGSSSAVATDESTVPVAAGAVATAISAPEVKNPALWSLESPNLYTVKTEVLVDGKVVDTYETDFGFRWFSFTNKGFALNGENVKLNGVCLHHDQGAAGAAAYYDAMYRQLSIMKDMGCNAIRTSHNPADKQFIEICSELGLLVIEEHYDGITKSKNGNSYDFCNYFTRAVDTRLYGADNDMICAEYATRSIVKRDRNQPSVFAWSYGNEIQEGNYINTPDYETYCKEFINWINAEDGTRIATMGDNSKASGYSYVIGALNAILDAGGVVGFNYHFGQANIETLAQNYGGDYDCVIASETASHVNSRGIYTTQSSQANADGKYHLTSYDESRVGWGATAHDSMYDTFTRDYVAGQFVWTGFDYIGEPTPWNGTGTGDSGRGTIPNSSYFGIVETTGFPKDNYYLYRAQWNREDTTVNLVTAWDSDNMMTTSGKTPVWVYTNAPVVKLYRNDEHIGTTTRAEQRTAAGHVYYTYKTESVNSSICSVQTQSGADSLYSIFNVAYEAGTLSAKAFDEKGNEIVLNENSGNYSVTTPGAVSKLVVTQDKTTVEADSSSLVYVTVDVTDANGNLKTTATNNISFTVEGPGEIVGVDNGDQATVRKYQNSYVKTSDTTANINAYAGKALVIIRTTEDPGTITVNVASSGLTSGKATINATGEITDTDNGIAYLSMVKDYSVKVGTKPALDTAITGTLGNGSTVTGTIAWESISSEIYGTAGDYVINGTASFSGYDPIEITARLHVVPQVVAMRNISTATLAGLVPTMPSTVNGVLIDGTVTGNYVVAWESVDAAKLAEVGDLLTVNGVATVLGEEILPVTCTIRVAEAKRSDPLNIAPAALTVTQDIPDGSTSDNLDAINNEVTAPGDNTNERWTNWGYRTTRDTATITMKWATINVISGINIEYYYDNCCAKPAAVEFYYSDDGLNFTLMEGVSETHIEDINLGARYSYAFPRTVNPIAIQVKLTQQNGTSGNNCVGITELEVMSFSNILEANTSADLSGITVNGKAVDGFVADKTEYEVEGDKVAATTAVNAGITILPAYEGVVRILTVSEDGSAAKTYELAVAGCQHADTVVQNASAATCTTAGYSGDTYCNDCQQTIETGTTIPATGHQNKEIRNAKPATCTAEGYSGDTWCKDCNTKISTGTTVAIKDHSWDEGVVKEEATESENGIKTFTCTVCGATKEESYTFVKVLKVPSVSLDVTTNSDGKIVIKGAVDDFENLDDYCEITSHGVLYIRTSRVGNRLVTVDTNGRTRVNFSAYKPGEGSFTYKMAPVDENTNYAIRAFLIYTDQNTGRPVAVYSDMIRGCYNTLK